MIDAILFYNPTDPYGFLANYAISPIELDGASWLSVEHYYQAQKFPDPAIQAAIRAATTPGKAKALAWSRGDYRADWDEIKDGVMLRAMRAKFDQHADLAAQLLATGHADLAEHTTKDLYWADGGDGSGKNRAGTLLMQVRAELVAQARPTVNRVLLDWLFETGKIRLARGDIFDQAPSAHAQPAAWDRVEGMLLGLAIGDALGNTSEAQNPPQRKMKYGEIRDYRSNWYADNRPVGLPSDDSQMAFWTLDQLNREHGLVPRSLAVRFTCEQIFGIGGSVKTFLSNFKDQNQPWYAAGPESAGNGALMRIAPLLIPHLRTPSCELWVDTALAAMITHNDAASTSTCIAFVAMLWELLARTSAPEPEWWVQTYVNIARKLETATHHSPRDGAFVGYAGPMWQYVETRLLDANARNLTTFEACETWHSAAYLMETLPSVLYILMRHSHDPEEAIVRAVNDTRDNDTVAAIVGAAVGALHGAGALPQRWRANLLGRLGAADDGRLFALIAATHNIWLT